MNIFIFIWWVVSVPLDLIAVSLSWLGSPVFALFKVTKPRTDVVKRRKKQTITLPRDYLLPIFSYVATHDNAADEWWYGMYNIDFYLKFVREWTQLDYDNSWLIRYFCRIAWIIRNPAYGFAYQVLGINYINESPEYEYVSNRLQFKIKCFTAVIFGKTLRVYNIKGDFYYSSKRKGLRCNFNLGYKAHKGFNRLMHAARFNPFRPVKN